MSDPIESPTPRICSCCDEAEPGDYVAVPVHKLKDLWRAAKRPDDSVTIPRAEYEAYRAVIDVLLAERAWLQNNPCQPPCDWKCDWHKSGTAGACYCSLEQWESQRPPDSDAALRAAGIHETEGGEPRPVTGFFAGLTPEQQKEALEYRGDDAPGAAGIHETEGGEK